MPGYILHLTAARMYLDIQPSESRIRKDAGWQNDFFIGNLLPDTVKRKDRSHFRDPAYCDRMMEWPHPDLFIRKYANRMKEAVYQGYYFHLCIDRYFFRDYIPKVAVFYNEMGTGTERKDEIREVLLKKSGERIDVKRYLSEEYYYGDYTKMNTWLCRHYNIPDDLRPGMDPGIEEADYGRIRQILKELEQYKEVDENAVKDLKVFDLKEMLAFLQHAAQLLNLLMKDF